MLFRVYTERVEGKKGCTQCNSLNRCVICTESLGISGMFGRSWWNGPEVGCEKMGISWQFVKKKVWVVCLDFDIWELVRKGCGIKTLLVQNWRSTWDSVVVRPYCRGYTSKVKQYEGVDRVYTLWGTLICFIVIEIRDATGIQLHRTRRWAGVGWILWKEKRK